MTEQFAQMIARTEPGPGVTAHDDGTGSHIKNRSVPNVATTRLHRELARLHDQTHTVDGLHANDAGRRSLVESGMKIRIITHELRLRGEAPGDCRACWGPE